MVVGLLRVTLHVPEAHSLKDRRSAVRRAVDRVRARFNVSIAEVGDASRWQIAHLAVATVSNDRALVNEVLDRVVSTIANAGAALVTHREMEILSYGDREPLGEGGPEADAAGLALRYGAGASAGRDDTGEMNDDDEDEADND